MEQHIPNVRLRRVVRGTSSIEATKKNRKNHLLLLKASGKIYYYIEDQVEYLKSGDVIFLPEGTSYSVKGISAGTYIAVSFQTDHMDAPPCKLWIPDAKERFEKLYTASQKQDSLTLLSLFFDLLHRLSLADRYSYLSSKSESFVKDAVSIIEQEAFRSDFRLSSVPQALGISHVYFCKLFRQTKGITPSQYLATLRLEKAKSLLRSGARIAEAATQAGFSDPLYFSKFFRKQLGISPSQYVESTKA